MLRPAIAAEARAALRRHVLEPLLPRCIDREYGGFLVDFDERWQPAGPHEKTLEHASRTAIAFALMEQAIPGEGCEEIVRHGCVFLRDVMYDSHHGGFFAKVDRAGKPCWDGMKHPHAVTYVAVAFLLAAPYLSPGEGREWARRALEWLDDVAWDPVHGGYWGTFRRDNQRYADGERLPTPHGRDVLGGNPQFKELNTLGDAVEMLTEFVSRGIPGKSAVRLDFLCSLVAGRLVDPAGALPYRYRTDWRPVADLIRVGEQCQLVHRLVDAAAVTGAGSLIFTAGALADFCLASARHPAGGFCLAVAGDGRTWPSAGPSADSRYWWVQFEAAYAFHVLSTQEGLPPEARARYRAACGKQWRFVRETFFDNRFGGVRELPEDSNARWRRRLPHWLTRKPAARKTHGWKDPYHEVVTFLALAQAEDRCSTANVAPQAS
jgi:mannose/cellobiose epimerase-like protein (N-acyl-D-glucosamine 2-epimerase family)